MKNNILDLRAILKRKPDASAFIHGSPQYSKIHGIVKFYQTVMGTVVAAEINGLPAPNGNCKNPIFGFHIHGGASCTEKDGDPFGNAGTHYDPHGCHHPYHSGDMPPLFGSGGYSFLLFLTDRFTVPEIIGKTIIIHSSPDDFTTQPAGNPGAKIACGEITSREKTKRL